MRKSIEVLVDEMKTKLDGYATLMYYNFMNLCIKAEPMALLSLTITDDEGEDHNIEDVANAMLADDYTFEIVPNENDLMFPICKGVMQTHPEFKQEIIKADENNRLDFQNEEEQHLLCRMPEVNKERHDFLMDTVGVLYDGCKVQLDKTHEAYKVKLTPKLAGMTDDEMNEAKDKLESAFNQINDMATNYRTNKEKEIEEAYQKWLAEQKAKADAEAEKAAARGEDKGFGLRMDSEEFGEHEE
ncbi:MAG: ribosome recycling factor [Prevotella sp.]|nr:ribosome recycling factor [Prevotella sp.]